MLVRWPTHFLKMLTSDRTTYACSRVSVNLFSREGGLCACAVLYVCVICMGRVIVLVPCRPPQSPPLFLSTEEAISTWGPPNALPLIKNLHHTPLRSLPEVLQLQVFRLHNQQGWSGGWGGVGVGVPMQGPTSMLPSAHTHAAGTLHVTSRRPPSHPCLRSSCHARSRCSFRSNSNPLSLPQTTHMQTSRARAWPNSTDRDPGPCPDMPTSAMLVPWSADGDTFARHTAARRSRWPGETCNVGLRRKASRYHSETQPPAHALVLGHARLGVPLPFPPPPMQLSSSLLHSNTHAHR